MTLDTGAALQRLAVALLVGLLLGLDRERTERIGRRFAGIRTFPLIAISGALATLLRESTGPILLVVSFVAVVAVAVVSYARSAGLGEVGATTEIAAIVAFLLGVILLLPESFFVFVFGQGFAGVKIVMLTLAAGIALLSVSIVISPYFSGTGRPWVNTVGAAIGLVFTLLLSFLLVPSYGITGAGISASVAYAVSTVFQLVVFVRVAGIKASDFLIHKDEFQALRQVWRSGLFIKTRDS